MQNYRESELRISRSNYDLDNMEEDPSRVEFSKSLIIPPRAQKSTSNDRSKLNRRRASEWETTPDLSTN